MQETKNKNNSKQQKPSKVPDSWREHLTESATALAQVVLCLARKGGGDFWTAEVAMVRSDVAEGSRAFVVTTSNPDDDAEPGIVSKRMSPQACAKKLWSMADHHATEYAAEHDLSQLRCELKLFASDGNPLNVSENTRAVINCAFSEDSVTWMSEDDGPAEEGLQARLNASQARELRVMSKLHHIMDRRESQVSTVISATEQLGTAATRLVEARLEAADTLANEVMKNAYGSRMDEYGEQVMAVLLPKLDSALDAFIAKHGGPDSTATPSDDCGAIDVEVAEATTDQPPGEFFSWVFKCGGADALAAFTRDLSSAPTEGVEVRKFWAVIIEALGERLQEPEAEMSDPPEEVKRWARGLVSRYTLTSAEWAA